MDSLINSLETFSLTKDEKSFEDSLDDIIGKLKNNTLDDPDKEWEDLASNYNKLRYLKELINSFDILPEFFMKPLYIFMENIDKMTQYYLSEIDWYHQDHDIHQECIDIQTHLVESLNTNNAIHKLNCVIKAYSALVPLVEEFRRERYNPVITDDEFLKTFKKRKLI